MDFEQFCELEHLHQQQTPDNQGSTELSSWQRWLYRRPLSATDKARIPSYALSLHQGWQRYTQGDYLNAFANFSANLVDDNAHWPGIKLDAAIGLCRIYTRIGHWQSARAWGVYALNIARENNRAFDISRSFNALGDLFCRANEVQIAHVCLTTAANILPKGTIHKARHLNSIATVLMRQGELHRAESMLMNSLYLAKDTSDSDSVWHALARIQWLYLESSPDTSVLDRFSTALPTRVSPIARSYIDLGIAVSALKNGDNAKATTLFTKASQRTLMTTPIESLWFQRCAGQPVKDAQAKIFQLPRILPKDTTASRAFDSLWLAPKLADNQLEWLVHGQSRFSVAEIQHQRNCFFI